MDSQDDTFGPHLPGAFDFTLLFEQSILSLLPTTLFIVAALWRFGRIVHRPTCVVPSMLSVVKLTIAGVFAVLQVTLLILWSLPSSSKTKASIAAAAVGVLSSAVIVVLSFLEHRKSIKPSALLNLYLFLTAILDLAQVRSLHLRPGMNALAGVSTATLVVKCLLLVAEEMPKQEIYNEKTPCREKRAGVISRGIFWWLNRFLSLGSKGTLGVDDIGTIHDKFEAEKLLHQLETEWQKRDKTKPYSLMWATFLAYRRQFFAGVIPRLIFSAFTFAQPFLTHAVVEFVGSPLDERDSHVADSLIGATLLVYVGIAISSVLYRHATYQLVTMYRGGLVALVYKKTLTLNPGSIQNAAPVTLMSTDVEGVSTGTASVHDIWASLAELPVALYLLYRQVGPPGLFILIPAAFTTALGLIISPKIGSAMVIWNKAVEERVGETSSMLSQIKGVKMMGLTNFFDARLRQLRAMELDMSTKFRWLVVYLNTFATVSEVLTPVIVIVSAVFWTKADQGLSITEAFTSLSIITIAAAPITHILISLMDFFRVIGCFTRLQDFLNSPPRVDPRTIIEEASPTSTSGSSTDIKNGVELKSVVPKDDSDADDWMVKFEDAVLSVGDAKDVLNNITIEFRRGTLSMVVGRVGCGKSCLLRAMIGEMELKSGTIKAKLRRAAYCDQTSWVMNISIQDNIVGQSEYDQRWLEKVLHACCLDEDVLSFSNGLATIVGSGGVALSGGQKQRVALARAAYTREPVVILDDVFSGLDNKTSRLVFRRLLGPDGLLRKNGQTVVLATNNVNILSAADCITTLENGCVIRNQVSYDSVPPAEWGVSDYESSSETVPKVDDHDNDDDDEERTENPQSDEPTTEEITKQIEEELSRQTGDAECYKIYIKSMGVTIVVVSAFLLVFYAAMTKMPQIWLRLWTQRGTKTDNLGYMGAYIGFSLLCIVASFVAFAYFAIVGIPRSSNRLHRMLLETVIRAPLSFFTRTDQGITLNRFSQDMSLIDQSLPMFFFATVFLVTNTIADTAIIASGSSYIGAVLPVGMIALYFIQRYYLRTSRQVRFLDLEMKSPLYTQFSETITGLSTIRAFGWVPEAKRENSRRLNLSQKPFYMMFCIQRWLQVVLDLFAAAMAFILVSFAVKFPWTTSKGAIGLAMVNVISFNITLTSVIVIWTQLETSLGAIARLKWFMAYTPNENKSIEIENPPSDWPSRGLIELRDVVAAYTDEAEPVLKGVNLTIQPGQKVGICGRSGSGKSSLILTLSRLLELQGNSKITIDGVDLASVPRQTIRSCVTALPQDALRLAGTVRHNLDPEGLIQADELLINALTKTSIWPFIESHGGLDATLDDLKLSAGQLQLFCLTRIVLGRGRSSTRHSAVVVLDEATSNVDPQTDDEVREALRPDLEGRTVIEVAHHLDIVRNYDVIVVMGDGRVMEVGSPDELLARPGSEFQALWASRGL